MSDTPVDEALLANAKPFAVDISSDSFLCERELLLPTLLDDTISAKLKSFYSDLRSDSPEVARRLGTLDAAAVRRRQRNRYFLRILTETIYLLIVQNFPPIAGTTTDDIPRDFWTRTAVKNSPLSARDVEETIALGSALYSHLVIVGLGNRAMIQVKSDQLFENVYDRAFYGDLNDVNHIYRKMDERLNRMELDLLFSNDSSDIIRWLGVNTKVNVGSGPRMDQLYNALLPYAFETTPLPPGTTPDIVRFLCICAVEGGLDALDDKTKDPRVADTLITFYSKDVSTTDLPEYVEGINTQRTAQRVLVRGIRWLGSILEEPSDQMRALSYAFFPLEQLLQAPNQRMKAHSRRTTEALGWWQKPKR